MALAPDTLCIGSVHWDVIGRAGRALSPGSDAPGTVSRQPGGVALNIAVALRRLGMRPALLSAIGRDTEGTELLERCRRLGLDTDHVYLSDDTPTDRYVAVEDPTGLIAAIAETRCLEAAGDRILVPAADGRLGSLERPYPGCVAIDGNLTGRLLAELAGSPLFAAADIRVASASPEKAKRLLPLLACPRVTLYLNLHEASRLGRTRFGSAPEAARALRSLGAARVLVTDGERAAAAALPQGLFVAMPPKVAVAQVTGAGDAFMAAHIVADRGGAAGEAALGDALQAAALHVAGGVPA